MPNPSVTVIILNYNGRAFLAPCLDSLLRSTHHALRILVVDNGSTDGSLDLVRSDYPTVETLDNGRNLYFCKGNNRGIEHALGQAPDYLFVLNNDTTVAPDCVERLVAFMERTPTAGACQPLLLFMERPDLINSAGCRCTLSGKTWDDKFMRPRTEASPAQVLGVTGGAMFVRPAALARTGGFCEAFTMYSEDVDLSLRLRSAGWDLYLVPEALVWHKFGASAETRIPLRKIFFCERNSYWVVLRNFPPFQILRSFALCAPFRLLIAAWQAVHGRFGYAACILLGLGIGLASFPVLFPLRLLKPGRTRATCPFWRYMDDRHLVPPPHRQGETV